MLLWQVLEARLLAETLLHADPVLTATLSNAAHVLSQVVRDQVRMGNLTEGDYDIQYARVRMAIRLHYGPNEDLDAGVFR
jgi:hypothetical protein